MKVESWKNVEGQTIVRLFDDNSKTIMEEDIVDGKARGKYFNGKVVMIGVEVFRIAVGSVSQVIVYENIEELRRVKAFEE